MSEPWYQDGLRFACTQCGHCCGGGEPGNIFISDDEAKAMADRLGLDLDAFLRRYTRNLWRNGQERRSLTEQANYDCIFFARGVGCTIYEQRPLQCRTWPFWRSNLGQRSDWDEAAEDCPGMNQGPVVDADAIAQTAGNDGLP